MNENIKEKKKKYLFRGIYCFLYVLIIIAYIIIYNIYNAKDEVFLCLALFFAVTIFSVANMMSFEKIDNIRLRKAFAVLSGAITILGSLFMYHKEFGFLEDCVGDNATSDKMTLIMRMTIYALLFLLGAIFVYLNITKKWLPVVGTVFFCFIFGFIVTDFKVLIIPLLISISFGLFIIVKKFVFEFSVIATFDIYLIIVLLVYHVLTLICPELFNKIGVLYGVLSASIALYMYLGTRINSWFIKFLDTKESSASFDYAHLKNDIFLLYLFIFVGINIGDVGIEKDFINNIFLTGLAIIQVDWNMLLRRKKDRDPN